MRQRWPSRLWLVRHGQSAGNVARDAVYNRDKNGQLQATQEAALAELRDRFAGCLCQNCLLAFANHPADELSNDAASIAE